jgi:hypothetical protein
LYLLGLTTTGCADTISVLIELEPEGNVQIETSASEICAGESVEFTGTGGDSYFWLYQNDTISTDPTVQLTLNSNATIGLAGTVSVGCPRFDQSHILGNENPEAIITLDGLEFTSSEGESYQWYFDGIEIAGATAMTYAANSTGNYHVKLIDIKGCSDESDPLEITITSLQGIEGSTWLSVYPNPNSGFFSLDIKSLENGKYDYQMLDASGKVIKAGTFKKISDTHSINFELSQEEPGVYFLQIRNGDNIGILKIIK